MWGAMVGAWQCTWCLLLLCFGQGFAHAAFNTLREGGDCCVLCCVVWE